LACQHLSGGFSLSLRALAPLQRPVIEAEPQLEGANHVFGVLESGWSLPRACVGAANSIFVSAPGVFICLNTPVARMWRENLRFICSVIGYLTQGYVSTSVLARGLLLLAIGAF
jgi:hypothetical protein